MKNFISRISISLAMIFALSLAMVALAPRAEAAEPVSAKITAINAKTGLVTAKEIKTGKTFQFKVNPSEPVNVAKLLKSLKVGQKVFSDFTKGVVSVSPDGTEPCCEIVQPDIMNIPNLGR